MKVAFLADSIDIDIKTGQRRVAYHIITGLANHGIDVTLLYSDLPERSIYKDIKKNKYRIWNLPLINEYVKFKLINFKAGKFDIFHDLTNYGMALGRSRAKKIITLHDIGTLKLPQFYRNYTRYRMNRVREILKNTDAVITVSEYQKKEISEYYKISEDRLFVVYPGVDTDIFKKTKDKRLIDGEYIMYLGNLMPKKGVCCLIRAFNAIKKQIPHNLLLGGMRGFKSETVFSLIKELDLQTKVIVRENPGDAEIVNYLSYASAFVYPSFYEGFGLPPLEAMACGSPVITSDNTSLKEIYSDSAILINPENINGLGDSILALLRDEAFKRELISKGYATAQRFSWDAAIRNTLKVYEKAII